MKPFFLSFLIGLLSLSSCANDPTVTDIYVGGDIPCAPPPPSELQPGLLNVGILVMDGVYNTELTAPYDIFQHTIFRDSIQAMNVFTIAQERRTIRTFEGLQFYPDYGFDDGIADPAIDILVVPSAEHHLDTDLENEKLIAFVSQTAEKARFVTSHCDGAFVLAKAGLLDNVASTTFPSDRQAMRDMFPGLDVRDDVLFVHDGKYITSAGGAKSFEAALYLCEHLYGKKVADELAEGLVIDWDLAQVPHFIGKVAD